MHRAEKGLLSLAELSVSAAVRVALYGRSGSRYLVGAPCCRAAACLLVPNPQVVFTLHSL